MIIFILALVGAGFFYGSNLVAAELVNINTAALNELDSLPGIGPVKARAIIDYRALEPFQAIEDIMKVSGIGQATFENLKDLITVGEPGVMPAPAGDTASTTEKSATPLIISPLAEEVNEDKKRNNLGDVLINEFVSDPADGEVEWLELYNKTGEQIDLSGWRIEEGSGAKTKLDGSLEKFKVIEKPAGNLNNAGDLIILYDAADKIIDRLAYGDWDDGDAVSNAPAAGDPGGTARKFDGYNTFNNANDFAVTSRPTKGASNIIEIDSEVSAEAKANYDFSNDIFITEIMPNPAGSDTKAEYIELYNAGARPVDLTGWSLANESGKKKNIENMATSSLIGAGQYLAIYRPKSKIVLRNDSGEARLYQPLDDRPLRTAEYKDVREGWSYNLKKTTGGWVWSEIITPGAANEIKEINHAPEVDFSFKEPALAGAPARFDGSDTTDEDGDELIYEWDFGDGIKNSLPSPEHTFFSAGIYEVKLSVSDGQESAELVKSVKALGGLPAEQPEIASSSPAKIWRGTSRNDMIVINELLPNPAGADTGAEWLEIKNSGAAPVDLAGWRVENDNGKFKLKDGRVEAESIYLLSNAESKLAFKNSSDTVSLYNDLDGLVDAVSYAAAVEGEAYARGANGNWFWTRVLTPGEENIISLGHEASIKYQALSIQGGANEYLAADLDKIGGLEAGSLVKISGVAAVEPGVLGAQIFYLAAASTSTPAGAQIYSYKKDFPKIKAGDLMEISGELSLVNGETRIKTKTKDNLVIISQGRPPAAPLVSCDQISQEMVGRLIAVSGEITDKKSSTLYLDDGSDEILVYFKASAGLDSKNLAVGQAVKITGILSRTLAGLRLLPRYQSDIELISSGGQAEPQVLGEVIAADEWALAERDKKLELFRYLLIIAGGVIILLAGLYVRALKA